MWGRKGSEALAKTAPVAGVNSYMSEMNAKTVRRRQYFGICSNIAFCSEAHLRHGCWTHFSRGRVLLHEKTGVIIVM